MTLIRRGKYWHYGFQMDGRRYRGSTKESVKARAAQYEQVKMGRVRDGGGPVAGRPLRLEEWAPLFLKHCDEMVAADLLAKTAVAAMRLDRIEREDCQVLYFPGSAAYTNCALRTLRRMLHAAVERKRLIAAPKIRCIEETGRTQLVEEWMEAAVLRHAEHPLYEVVMIISDTGMRPEEIMRMRRSHILWERSSIIVSKSKTSRSHAKPRYVPLSDRVRAALAEHEGKPDDWIFPSSRSKSGHRPRVDKQWKACRKAVSEEAARAGYPQLPDRLVLYCGRHTFATDLYKESKNLKLVQDTLGHSDIKITMKYLHPEVADSAELINARNRRREMKVVEKTG
jgi:integrase